MDKKRRSRSLHRQMSLIILLCWLLPMAIAATLIGGYLVFGVGRQTRQSLEEQFQLKLQMGAERLNNAVEASRLPSYDPEFRSAWSGYQADGNYAALYRRSYALFNRLYQTDSRFLYGVFCFSEDPARMAITVVNGSAGLLYGQAQDQWREDMEPVLDLAAGLDTAVGFLEHQGRVYLVRNLMDSSYSPTGVLALALAPDYYFEDLSQLPWASAVSLCLGADTQLLVKGERPPVPGEGALEQRASVRGCVLQGTAGLDYGMLLAGSQGYLWLLLAMLLSLLLLLALTFRFFQRRISRPISALMEGASEIRRGALGHQIARQTGSREFEYLTDSFNQMSGQLKDQFNRLYQEELARKDAQIKALQAHINPHFLNNTLESISWQSRLSGDVRTAKMIEALSTVLDAALDRRGRSQVRLAEEMSCVNAYLYIIKQRFGKRLTVNVDLPEELMDCMVPPLILQPVIENAVEHGIGPGGQGLVTLRGCRREGFLILDVENSGGLTPQDAEHIARLLSPGYDILRESSGNIGIANVNLRLRILYGAECGLTIFPGEGSLVTARLTIALPEGG